MAQHREDLESLFVDEGKNAGSLPSRTLPSALSQASQSRARGLDVPASSVPQLHHPLLLIEMYFLFPQVSVFQLEAINNNRLTFYTFLFLKEFYIFVFQE